MKEFLKSYMSKLNIELREEQISQFEIYKNLLVEWNKVMNLTGITEDNEIAIKHFADSITPLNIYNFKNKRVIDVGTGAGFPGFPLKIAEPTIELCLLDSLQKRINFLEKVGKACNISAEYIHGRAEELGQNEDLREQFDIAVSRAVAPLNILCEYALPFVKTGGVFMALKGPDVYNEAELCKNALSELGGSLLNIKEVELPDTDLKHNIVIIEKISSTPAKYPRRVKKIDRSPL